MSKNNERDWERDTLRMRPVRPEEAIHAGEPQQKTAPRTAYRDDKSGGETNTKYIVILTVVITLIVGLLVLLLALNAATPEITELENDAVIEENTEINTGKYDYESYKEQENKAEETKKEESKTEETKTEENSESEETKEP